MTFRQKVEKIIKKNNSLLSIGLDPNLEKFPKHILKKKNPIFEFNKKIIDATHDLVCVYKPNIAFYEAHGIDGLKQLKQTFEYLQSNHPEIPIILDAKRADIENTARMYAKSVFEYWDADGVTVFPHLGLDSLMPFLNYENKLTILLLKTSNPDSSMFQNLLVNGKPYYLEMAKKIRTWNYPNIGFFVGATYPQELKELRSLFPNSIFLSAGLGAQSAEIEKAVRAGINKDKNGIMFNASRSILYSKNPRTEAKKLKNEINKYR